LHLENKIESRSDSSQANCLNGQSQKQFTLCLYVEQGTSNICVISLAVGYRVGQSVVVDFNGHS